MDTQWNESILSKMAYIRRILYVCQDMLEDVTIVFGYHLDSLGLKNLCCHEQLLIESQML